MGFRGGTQRWNHPAREDTLRHLQRERWLRERLSDLRDR